ncbi:heme exporter protein CcmD [Nitrincola tapanii]|uniref:Heme exporter protein D n=1 Tax=Nitrincola tapanii TaxID=1708751 RepID=A0A5A9W212_9GAMM|nr:heme exporter protein CcmD [Nitrincola tapanii]KAA0874766.1 heme exporter protein CcmD [Nitrincola tapanii]
MSFNTFAEFLAMGGHGLYVWSCYGLGLVVLLWLIATPMLQRRRLLSDLSRRLRREETTP